MVPLTLGIGIADGLVRALQNPSQHGAFPASSGSAGAGFGAVLADVAKSAADAVSKAEEVSTSAINGKASARDVVEGLMRAEQELQVAIAVRDKAISAFQEISRMAI